MLLTEKEAKGICERLLRYTKADDAEVSVSSENYSHLRFAVNDFTTNGQREDVRIHVTVWIERKRGSSTTNGIDDASLKAAAQRAEELARLAPVDVEYLPTLGPQRYQSAHGYVEATENISPRARAKTIRQVIDLSENAKVIAAGFHQARGAATAFATRNGNFHYERSSLVSLSMTARTVEGNGSGYFLRNHFDAAKLDAQRIAQEAIRKSLDSRNPRPLEPGVYSVILEPQAAADLLSHLPAAFDARSADEGRSALSAPSGKTRLGEKLFDDRINFRSDPWNPFVPDSSSAQDGIPAQKLHLIRNGIVENLIYSRFWAKQKGKEPTPGPVNTLIEASGQTVTTDAMIKATTRGLLVGRFWYIRMVDARSVLLTGLTRDGVWYIENGKIQYPIRNFRFNQSIIRMLAPGNFEMIGASERVGRSEGQGSSAGLFPALKLREFNFTSVSEAV